MPELAEVEYARWTLEKHLQGKPIVEVITIESGGGPRHGKFDDTVFEKTSIPDGATFESAIKGTSCKAVLRKGKHLWWDMEKVDEDGNAQRTGLHPLFHFRMTGSFVVKGVPSQSYMDFKVHDEEWPPRFTKCEFVLADGTRVAFTNQRRFGRICLRKDPAKEAPVSKLAPDPYTEMPSLAAFTSALQSSKLSIKALLMNQERVVCGLGNWIVDEVIFQSRLHPETASNDLTEAAIARVHKAIVTVCTQACKALQAREKFPETWLFHKRWGKGKGPAKILGHKIDFITVGGRTSAIVPALQKKTNGTASAKSALKDEPSVDTDTSSPERAEEKTKTSRKRPRAASAKSRAKPRRSAALKAKDESDQGNAEVTKPPRRSSTRTRRRPGV